MFSANHKISTRQIKYLLLMEWIAKPCILLPVCLEKKSLGSVIFCVAFGIVFWAAVVTVLFRWIRPGEDLFGAVSRVLGVWPARILYGIGGLYFLAQAAVFLNLTAELAGQYLLPEVPLPMLCFLPLLCGIYLGGSGIEVRGRFCEVTGPVVLGLMVLAAVLSVFGIDGQLTEETLVRGGDGLTTGAFEVFACLGGMFVPLSGNSFQDIGNKAVRRAGILAGLTGGSLCAIAVASYGKNGIGELEFPVVRVMSNVKIPGNFLQRWDILFLALLLMTMLVTVAGSFWYMREILLRLLEERQQLAYGLWGGGIVLSYLMAAGFLSAFTAICYYRAWNMQVVMPILLFSYLLLGIRSRVKMKGHEKHRSWEKRISAEEGKDNTSKRYKRAGKVLMLVCVAAAVSFYLSGCTAREPEERLFPMALEISIVEPGTEETESRNAEEVLIDQPDSEAAPVELKVTYAWDQGMGSDPGSPKTNDEDSAEEKDLLTSFYGETLMDVRRQVTAFSERYVDYSHVKAIILDENLQEDPDLELEVVQWFAGEPAFASGLIVYPAQASGLTLEKTAQNSSGEIGTYLEQLYKNNAEYRESSTTLGRIIAEYFA